MRTIPTPTEVLVSAVAAFVAVVGLFVALLNVISAFTGEEHKAGAITTAVGGLIAAAGGALYVYHNPILGL